MTHYISVKENQKPETNLHLLSIDLPLSSLRDVSITHYESLLIINYESYNNE